MVSDGAQIVAPVEDVGYAGGPAAMLGVTISFMAIGIFVVTLRLYLRIWVLKAFGFDDILIVVALVCFILQTAFVENGIKHGIGKHLLSLPIPTRVLGMQMLVLWELTYVATTTFIKASIGASLLRLTVHKRWRWILWGGMSIDFLTGIVTFFYILCTCSPISYQWTAFDPTAPVGHCQPAGDLAIVGYVFFAITCAIYLLFAVSPIFMLWSVQMEPRTKYSVMFVLALGLVSMVANMVRLKYLGGVLRSVDVLYTVTNDLIWSIVECGTGMIAACIATYRPLLKMWRGRNGSGSWKGGYRETHGLDDIFVHGMKTTVVANPMRSTSEEDILGANIMRTVEITVEEAEAQKAASCVSRDS